MSDDWQDYSFEEYEQEAFDRGEDEEEYEYKDDGMDSLDYVNGPLEMVLNALIKALDRQIVAIARRAAEKTPRRLLAQTNDREKTRPPTPNRGPPIQNLHRRKRE